MAEVENVDGDKDLKVSPTEETSSKSPTKAETNEALQHLLQGKRHLLVKDVYSAVESLQKSCSLFAEQYGEVADQCGEAYFVYGKALLELTRLETGVIGEVGGGDDDSNDEDEDEDEDSDDKCQKDSESKEECAAEVNDSNDDEQKVNEGGECIDKDETECEGKTSSDDKSGEKESTEISAENGVESKENDACAEECDTEENGKDQNEDEEESVTNIQLAWEMLELAKVIFERQSRDKESDLRLSQVYLKLGEVSIESENYPQSVSDLKECLKLQQKHLDADSRLIAETQYQQGIAHSLANEFSDAVAAFGNAIATIQARIATLNRQIEQRSETSQNNNVDAFYKEEDEIKELKELLPDIDEKINDMKQMKIEAQRKLAEMFSDGSGPSRLADAAPLSPVKAIMSPREVVVKTSDQPPKQAQCISHLVKRKRPIDNGKPAHENGDAKKAKTDN